MPVSGALVWEATSYPGHVERRGDADAIAGAARYMCAEINAPSRSNYRAPSWRYDPLHESAIEKNPRAGCRSAARCEGSSAATESANISTKSLITIVQ